MTPEMRKTVKDVERLDKAATKGPWKDDDGYRVLSPLGACVAELKRRDDQLDLVLSYRDVAAIAAFRTAAPILAAEVVRLDERERQWVKGVLGLTCDRCDDVPPVHKFEPDTSFPERRDLCLHCGRFAESFVHTGSKCSCCHGTGITPDAIALLARMGMTVEQARDIAKGAE